MGEQKPYLRVIAFAGVLILVGGLITGLFNEARAVNVQYDNPPSTVGDSSSKTFTAHITVPNGERVPIDEIEAVVEQQNANQDDKLNANKVAHATCAMNGPEQTCPGDSSLSQPGANDDVVTEIEIGKFYHGQVGYGYEVNSGYFGQDNNGYFTTTGYGYDTVSNVYSTKGYGYGYGYDIGSTDEYRADQGHFDGYGYGYDGDDSLIIEVNVTLSGSALDDLGSPNTFYLTVIGDTGSATLGDISSPYTEFDVTSGAGGPGSGPPDGGGGGGGGAPDKRVKKVGLDRAFSVNADQSIALEDLPEQARINALRMSFPNGCDGCKASMTHHGGSPPSGTAAADRGLRAFDYFTLEVTDGNGDPVTDANGWITFEVSGDDLGADESPSQVVLAHHKGGEWSAEPTTLETAPDDGPDWTVNGTFDGLSTFAKATDTAAPEFSNAQPTGTIDQTSPQISADYQDNRGVDQSSFQLSIDGEDVSGSTGTLSVADDGFSYVHGTALAEGQHQVEAEISDESGNTATETWTFTVEEPECPELADLTNPQPADGATGITFEDEVSIAVAEGSCPIVSAELVVAGETVDTSVEDGMLTGEIPDSVSAGDTVTASATVTDEAGNERPREWSFTMAEDADPGEEGGGALVWVIVALVVLAIVGVGAYFYTQQGEGGS